MLNREGRELVNSLRLISDVCQVSVLFALSGPYPHWLVGVAGLLPLAAEQLLSKALLNDRIGICGRERQIRV